MGEKHARIFETMRPDILARLIEVRGSIDHAYARIPDDLIGEHFNILLDKVQIFLTTDDATTYRRFASRYVAIRVSEGFTHEDLIHSIIAIGDVVAQVARSKLKPSPERERFIRAVMRMNFVHARMLVAFLAEDLGERMAQRELMLRSLQ